uniref:Uncharacterized protein n=1 Tax=Glossina palpalis gambiensis TaxID=67801 RepID=A0A1B0B4K0_9MUSC
MCSITHAESNCGMVSDMLFLMFFKIKSRKKRIIATANIRCLNRGSMTLKSQGSGLRHLRANQTDSNIPQSLVLDNVIENDPLFVCLCTGLVFIYPRKRKQSKVYYIELYSKTVKVY